MTTIAELSKQLQTLLTTTAEKVARETGFIKRERQVTGAGFAQALVLGGLGQPLGTRKQTHHQAIQAGLRVSVQGLDQRFTENAVQFMRSLLMTGMAEMVSSNSQQVVMPQFAGIYVTDCTRLVWGKTGDKMAVQWELQRGQIRANLMLLTQHDQKAALLQAPLPPGSLHLGDLGFFNLKRFRRWSEQTVYWLTRFKVGTHLYNPAGQALDLKKLLTDTAGDTLTRSVFVGNGTPALKATLIAQRIPPAAFAKRSARLLEEARRDQRPLSQARLELAGWTIYLTNIPDLTFDQAHILARTRWQIELLFKLWKSQGQVLRSRSADPLRQRCEGYAKLLALLIAHWTLLVTGWEADRYSALDGLRVVRTYVPILLRAFSFFPCFDDFFAFVKADVALLPRLSKRRKAPRAFQLWYALEDSLA